MSFAKSLVRDFLNLVMDKTAPGGICSKKNISQLFKVEALFQILSFYFKY